MLLNNAFNNGESQTCALFAGSQAGKNVKNIFQVILMHANSVAGNSKHVTR